MRSLTFCIPHKGIYSRVELCTGYAQHHPVLDRYGKTEDICEMKNSIGKGVFANCFAANMGGLKAVCMKLLTAGDKYKSLFYSESKILSELRHFNLPWIHGLCYSSNHVAIIMTHHP